MSRPLRKINNFLLNNLVFVILILIIMLFISKKENLNLIARSRDYVAGNQEMVYADMSSPMTFSAKSSAMSVNSFSSDSAPSGGSSTNINSKIVKNFSLTIEVKNVEDGKKYIEEKVLGLNGQISNFYSYDYSNSNNLAYNFTLKIPSEKVENSIDDFKKLGIVKSESLSVTDMQESYSDNENRLKNLYARRERLRKMMDTKTEKLSDVISVDRELNSVQNQIESLEKSNKRIDNNVVMTNVNLTILPEVQIDNFNNSEWRLNTAWKEAINDLIEFSQKAMSYGLKFIVFSPFLFGSLIVFFIIKKIVNRF